MIRYELASDFSISRLLVGLWQIADMEKDGRTLDREEAAGALAPYVDAGFTTIDMADHYGSAEEIVGEYLSNQAGLGEAQVLTKWVPKPGPLGRDEVRAAVQRSLDRLRTDRIDLLQFHTWCYFDPSWLDALHHLAELRDEGLIRHLGLTNFDTAHLRIAASSGIDITTNQVCFSLLDMRPADRMTEFCLARGVRILAYGTLAGGFLSERWLGRSDPGWERLTWSQMKYRRFIESTGGWQRFQTLLRAVDGVAQRHDSSIANVASRLILDQAAVAGIIIGARLGENVHIEDNLRLLELELTDQDRQEVDEALSTLEVIPGDSGDEYRKPPLLTASGDLSHHLEDLSSPYPTRTGSDGRRLALSGTPWEGLAGFSRAVRSDRTIWISGTTATHGGRVVGGSDPAAQTHFVIDKLEGAIRSLGGKLEDIVRTRVYVRDLDDWEPIARAHGERFGTILPANTLVQSGLVGEEYSVEIDAEALIPEAEEHTE